MEEEKMKPLPCAFCGCAIVEVTVEAYDTLPGIFFRVKCANCPALMELSDRDHVIDRWNRRTESPTPSALSAKPDPRDALKEVLEGLRGFQACMEAQRKDTTLPPGHDDPDESCGDGVCYRSGATIDRDIALLEKALATLSERGEGRG